MEEGIGVRVRSSTIGITDAIIILFVIMLLGGTLTRLVSLKIPRLAAHAEEQIRAARSQLNLNLIGPQAAVAGAPPMTLEEALPPFAIDFEHFYATPRTPASFVATPPAKKASRARRPGNRYSARQSSAKSPTQK